VTDKGLAVTNQAGDTVVTWTAPDPIGKVLEVYASQYEDRIAVAYTTRRLGREVTDVVAFVLVKTTGRDATPPAAAAGSGAGAGPGGSAAPATEPAVAKALDSARKASKAKAAAAWKDVLALDGDSSEARYRLAALAKPADALDQLAALAKSSRPDAIEWLIDARFDPAFAALRAEPRFRAAVGLDRKPTTIYERLMGLGGSWEQAGTSCDRAEIRLTVARDRSFKLRVKSACEGQAFDVTRKGTWRIDGTKIVLSAPAKGQQATAKDEAPCQLEPTGDEDALRCQIDRDLEFVALPTRR
jgi:hypothetical protein